MKNDERISSGEPPEKKGCTIAAVVLLFIHRDAYLFTVNVRDVPPKGEYVRSGLRTVLLVLVNVGKGGEQFLATGKKVWLIGKSLHKAIKEQLWTRI